MALRTTETHRLIKRKDWNAANQRLATPEGKNEATLKDEEERLIFHLEELYDPEVPLQTLRAAHDANETGFIAKYGSIESEDITYPIFYAIRNSRPQVISFVLQLHPDSAKQKESLNRLPLHIACEEGNNEAVRLLLSVNPAAAAMDDDEGSCPIHLSEDCSFETQLDLLSTTPDITTGKKRFDNGNTLLHYATHFFKDYRTVESILHANPKAVKERNDEEDLPIHTCFDSKHVLSIELLDLMTQRDHGAMKEKGFGGMLPLHMLCLNFGGHRKVDGLSTKVINLFHEILRRYPQAAHEMATDLSLPLDCMIRNEENLDEHIIPAFAEIWCSLVAVAPQSLHRRHHDVSPFVRLSQSFEPPQELWTNAAIYFPTVLYSFDEKTEGSALSNSLYNHMEQEELLDGCSYTSTILQETFRCLRHAHYRDELIRSKVIEEDIPVCHMLAYCYHLLDRRTIPRFVLPIAENEKVRHLLRQKDSKGNTLMHTLCRAPCPKENKDNKRPERDRVAQDFFHICGANEVTKRDLLSTSNVFGDLPIHLLLRNRRPLFHQFNDLVDELIEGNKDLLLVVDSQEKLYPFMLAALNVARREKSHVCSLTFTLVRDFVASADMTTFCSKSSTTLRSQKRLDTDCERIKQDCTTKKRRL